MASSWDDFKETSKKREDIYKGKELRVEEAEQGAEEHGTGCDWGFGRQEAQAGDGELSAAQSNSTKFIPIYERYLEDKHSLSHQTKNYNMYGNNPQKAIREWFDNEGHEFSIKTDQLRENQFVCSLDIPLDDSDFTLSSETHSKKQDALDEICMVACKMLDECQLLYSWQFGGNEDLDKKRRRDEANKEDDIELDSTRSKRICDSLSSKSSKSTTPKVNTYESLMAKWNELNMSILQLKAKLVRLDLSVMQQQRQQTTNKASKMKTSDVDGGGGSKDADDDEIDPLDEYMSSLETKTKLSMDEKIEKSRIKHEIAAFEREQSEVSRYIELAKPKFDLNKACPPTSTNRLK